MDHLGMVGGSSWTTLVGAAVVRWLGRVEAKQAAELADPVVNPQPDVSEEISFSPKSHIPSCNVFADYFVFREVSQEPL
ncbi:hypothetical protein [Chitinimonas lacunae]|uniref:Uncharacterized protein n=1 Tax=Chitinimonas lacunae TaxID=1963018 RepID=A0ABV8MK93_9NEIS